ncbi:MULTISPECIES: pyroglutamyl-peptidase I [unclassified Luteococcus]|uniref:pyroglutamyl-peptidase I n=1 Tax=unclassified Luteococcus TaxID=2639923 RepID=UPI00313D959A
MRILVTGFDPFGGENINPAWEAVRALPDQIARAQIRTLQVPTVFGDAVRVVGEAIDQHQPDAVLCVGQAGGRSAITVERVAINVDDASIADNAGNRPIDEPVVPDGPDAYLATLPIKAMVQAIREAGLPASVSNSAGTFVCNHLMYGVLHHLASRGTSARGGFIHVPYIPQQTTDKPGMPSMSATDITRALTAALEAMVTHDADIRLGDGATH